MYLTLNYLQIALLRRAVEKFKSQLGASDTASMCSEVSPKNSLAYHRITPISPSYQVGDHKGRGGVGTAVTTSAIVSHEMDGSKSRRGSRLIYNGASMLPSTVHAELEVREK